jgi:hypothetical protein
VELEISFIHTIARDELVRTLGISFFLEVFPYIAGNRGRRKRGESEGRRMRRMGRTHRIGDESSKPLRHIAGSYCSSALTQHLRW